MHYTIRRADPTSGAFEHWTADAWAAAEVAELASARPESSSHRPRTTARLVYDRRGIYGRFDVSDRYVRSVVVEHNGPVCTDSCVEFFVMPDVDRGYLNFEFNAGGTMLLSHIEDPTRTSDGFKRFTRVPGEHVKDVRVRGSLPRVVEPEIADPVAWWLAFFIPFDLIERYVGTVGDVAGRTWRANFYKCGDKTSHPHWLSWAPVDAFNFHLPGCFAPVEFAAAADAGGPAAARAHSGRR